MRSNQLGLFLIEMMISIILSILLIHFILDIYQAAIKTDELQSDLRTMQTHTNLISAILYSEIHQAGYIGYASLSHEFPVISLFPYSLTIKNRIIGNDKEIIIRKMEQPISTLLRQNRDGMALLASNDFIFSPNDILIVSDHWHAEIFKVKYVSNKKNYQIIFPTQILKMKFNKNAEIGKFAINKLFVTKTKRKNNKGEPIYALYKSILKENNTFSKKIELIEGVRDIYFQYSVIRNKRLYHLSAKEISDWSEVSGVAVRLGMNQERLYKTRYIYVALRT